jgi:hypothetical protein
LFYLATLSLLILIYERAYIGGNDWRFTHLLFNYEIEFVKRGAIGELLRVLNYEISFSKIQYLWNGIAWITSLLFAYIIGRVLYIKQNTQGITLFFIAALTSSATIQHFVYDLGRFDSINLIFAIACFLAIEKLSNRLLILIVPTLCTVMLLIHEATFFLFIPMVISYWIFKKPSGIVIKTLVSLLLVTATYIISTQGLVENESFNSHYERLLKQYGSNVSASSVNVLHRDVEENLQFTAESLDTKKIYDHLSLLIGLGPLFFLFLKIMYNIKQDMRFKENWRLLLFVFSCMTPLLLYPLGEDHFRWWAILFTNLFIALAILAYQNENIYKNIESVFMTHKRLVITSIVLSVILGPLGNPSAYPYTINQYLINLF